MPELFFSLKIDWLAKWTVLSTVLSIFRDSFTAGLRPEPFRYKLSDKSRSCAAFLRELIEIFLRNKKIYSTVKLIVIFLRTAQPWYITRFCQGFFSGHTVSFF